SGTSSLARNCAAIFVAVGTSLRRKKLRTHVLKAHFVKSSYNVVRRSLPTRAGRFRDGVDSTPSSRFGIVPDVVYCSETDPKQVCVSDAGSDLVRLLNIDASVRDEASASPAYSGTRSSDRLVLSGVLLTVAPTQAPDELDDKQLPKAPDQDVFSYIATRFAEKQPALGKTECATAANDSASNQRFFNQKVQPNLGALEKHAYAHRGILQSFLTTPCCSNVTKM
ncbi:hypothetical protein MTO96_040415, partial [Rhipicephalus appendiculatus]